jgi:predicted ATPase
MGEVITEKFFILTGAPGSGKSTLLKRLRTMGYQGVDEPARRVLSELRTIDGNGIPSHDANLFVNLMLCRSIDDYRSIVDPDAPVFFDRGIPDSVGYAVHSGTDPARALEAAREYRYNRLVFLVPAWEEIYTTDDERTMSFEAARAFGEELKDAYERLDYSLIDVPCVSVEGRVEFISNLI